MPLLLCGVPINGSVLQNRRLEDLYINGRPRQNSRRGCIFGNEDKSKVSIFSTRNPLMILWRMLTVNEVRWWWRCITYMHGFTPPLSPLFQSFTSSRTLLKGHATLHLKSIRPFSGRLLVNSLDIITPWPKTFFFELDHPLEDLSHEYTRQVIKWLARRQHRIFHPSSVCR